MTKKVPDVAHAIDYSQRLLDSTGWIRCADSLLAAARLLEVEIEEQWSHLKVDQGQIVATSGRTAVSGPYFLLVAFALENFFKAVLLNAERPTLRNKLISSIPAFINEHDLLKLASAAKLSVFPEEEDLLRRLSRNSVWAGRYPVPTGPTAVQAVELYSDGRAYLTAYFASSDIERLRRLILRTRSLALESIEGAA
jgi:hypothetical protein